MASAAQISAALLRSGPLAWDAACDMLASGVSLADVGRVLTRQADESLAQSIVGAASDVAPNSYADTVLQTMRCNRAA